MKRTLIILTAFLATLTAHAQQRFTIQGELPDSLDGAKVELSDYEDNHVCATTFLSNGRFEFMGEIERDSIRRIDVSLDGKPVNYANIIVEAGEITVDFESHHAHGTPQNEAMLATSLMGRAGMYYKMLTDFASDPSHTKQQIDSLENALNAELETFQATQEQQFIDLSRKADNALSCWALWHIESDGKKAKTYVEAYNAASPYARSYAVNRRNLETARQALQIKVGDPFIDLHFPEGNADGTPARLSDYVGRGKFVIVDFWASWCGPCRAETPNLKAVYDRFHSDRFDILSVAVQDKREKTLKMISDENIPWQQIYCARLSDVETYGCAGIPLILLFSPDGRLLAYDIRGGAIMKAVEKALANQ